MAASTSCIVTGIRHRPTFQAPSGLAITGTGTVHPPSQRELRLASTPTVPKFQRDQSAAPPRGGVGKLPSHRGHPFSVTIVDVGDCHGPPSGLWRAKKRRAPAAPEKIHTERYRRNPVRCAVQFGGAIVQGSDSCYRDGGETIWGSAMSFSPERRQQCAKATAIDHAIDLACTHGLSFASAYLRNQRLRNETIARVLSGLRDQLRQHECSRIPPELPYTSEAGDASETPVRQLSYRSRQNFGHLR